MENQPAVVAITRLIQQGQLRKAIPEIERALALDPSDARLRLALAEVLTRSDAAAGAAEQLMQVARRYERDGSALKAIAVYLQALRIVPGHRDAALALARLYAEYGLFEDAAAVVAPVLASTTDPSARLAVIQTLLDIDPDNVADRVRLAEAYSAQGALQDAAREFRRVADALNRKAPDEVWARVVERLLYYQPDDVPLAKRLSVFYLRENAPQLALPRLRKAYEARPSDVEVLGLLVETFSHLGQAQKSIAVLKEMARLYEASGLVHERLECWQRVANFDPNDRDASAALESSGADLAGQTFDIPLHQFEAMYGQHRKGKTAPHDRPETDFEQGFSDGAENTIIDDVFVPDLLRRHQAALSLSMAPQPQSNFAEAAEDLKLLDFYLQTGQPAEAEALLSELRGVYGDHPELMTRVRRLSDNRA